MGDGADICSSQQEEGNRVSGFCVMRVAFCGGAQGAVVGLVGFGGSESNRTRLGGRFGRKSILEGCIEIWLEQQVDTDTPLAAARPGSVTFVPRAAAGSG